MKTTITLLSVFLIIGCKSSFETHRQSRDKKETFLAGKDVRATGNEPFWMLEIKNDSVLFSKMGHPGHTAILPSPVVNTTDTLIYYIPVIGDMKLNVTFVNQSCIDDMSGFKKRFITIVTAEDDTGETIYKGCTDYLSEYNKVMEPIQ